MKKSSAVLLSAFFIATTSSCVSRREWIDGHDEFSNVHDTVVDNIPYRYYRGGWFPVRNNLIRVPYYMMHSPDSTIARTRRIRTGGFSHTANRGVAHS